MFKLKSTLLVALIFVMVQSQANAQMKIGHASMELILAYMPETQAMNQALGTYKSKLEEQLQVKQNYAQNKLQEYQTKLQANQFTGTTQQEAELELGKLDQEIQKFAADSEQNLLAKRQEYLTPITEKLQKAIDDVANEGGYTYVMNQTNNGVSNVLFGPEEHNLTQKIMIKLGIQIPAAGGN